MTSYAPSREPAGNAMAEVILSARESDDGGADLYGPRDGPYDVQHGRHVLTVHTRRRRRISNRRSVDMGAAVARLGADGLERLRVRRSPQARDAQVDRRGRHEDLPQRPRA